VIFGTGGLATVFGARLARSGPRVTLVGSWPEALASIPRDGLTVVENQGSWSAPAEAAHIDSSLPRGDVALVLVKSGATARVASRVKEVVSTDDVAATLQNGLGNRETLEAVLERKVVQGVTTVGATLLGPAMASVFPGRVSLGLEAGLERDVGLLADVFAEAEFDVDVTGDIQVLLWRKLAVNCAINPLSALLEVRNGALLDTDETRGQLVDAAREVGAVAEARGVVIGVDPAALALEVARATADNRSSMLQDMQRGVATEIDALCGAVVREGRRLGVPTPVNARLMDEVRQREASLVS
jgi:2-dehydropantoate 2-reductase